MTATIVILLAVAFVLLLLVAAFRSRGSTMERLHVERRHDWEKNLSETSEEALLRGLEAWRDAGHDLLLYHEGAKIDVFEPPMVISLYALADAFIKAGTDEKRVPAILDDLAAKEQAGKVLHLSKDWATRPGVGDPAQFANTAMDALGNARAEVPQIERSGADEFRGVADLGIRAGTTTNTVAVDLARLADAIDAMRKEDDKTPFAELLRRALKSAVVRSEGALWMRPPTETEQELVRRAIDSSTIG